MEVDGLRPATQITRQRLTRSINRALTYFTAWIYLTAESVWFSATRSQMHRVRSPTLLVMRFGILTC